MILIWDLPLGRGPGNIGDKNYLKVITKRQHKAIN